MRFRFGFGKKGELGRLTAEQEAVVKRLEAGELTDGEAAAELGGSVRTWQWSYSGRDRAEEPQPTTAAAAEGQEDDAAKALVERIAREVDEEDG